MPGDNRLAVGVEKFMFKESMVEEFMVEKSVFKRSGVKLGVEISCNNIIKYMIKK